LIEFCNKKMRKSLFAVYKKKFRRRRYFKKLKDFLFALSREIANIKLVFKLQKLQAILFK